MDKVRTMKFMNEWKKYGIHCLYIRFSRMCRKRKNFFQSHTFLAVGRKLFATTSSGEQKTLKWKEKSEISFTIIIYWYHLCWWWIRMYVRIFMRRKLIIMGIKDEAEKVEVEKFSRNVAKSQCENWVHKRARRQFWDGGWRPINTHS